MARTSEESVMNAAMSDFVGSGKAKVVNPTKSYMAIGRSIPKVGEHYKCQRLDKNSSNNLRFYNTETTTVQDVKNLAGNVFVVTTKNSYYITRVLYMPVEDVHFAVIRKEPEIGRNLKCHKMEFSGEKAKFILCETSAVQEVKFIKGLYRVKTRNSIYVCFPMM